ncbi:hypothetical protein IMZ31_22495 (plasmid) [Pontibacillus sp. ALD_SL1]|uniref:hypothetical protein n=1 Tax=Pontibacillus sp. ALD_SL1 TaxID=2777185 RepID=UPI001A9726D4|nr:hypothetical protein [Pontibacillus sp. ALD_SL1]QST02226.1 hypothetical protein IMZ31_22495 [Pontibacillus sp. ALD_SL1]
MNEYVSLAYEMQRMASEFLPDEEGVIEDEDLASINEMIDARPEALSEGEQKELIRDLSHFCGEWFPDGGYSEEEIKEFQKAMAKAEEFSEIERSLE